MDHPRVHRRRLVCALGELGVASRESPVGLVLAGCGRYVEATMWSGSHTPTATLQAVGVRRSRDCR